MLTKFYKMNNLKYINNNLKFKRAIKLKNYFSLKFKILLLVLNQINSKYSI